MRLLLQRLCLVVAASLFAVLSADAVARATLHRSPIAEVQVMWQRAAQGVPLPRVWASPHGMQHPVYHHGMRPYCGGDELWGPGVYGVQTNSIGFRDETTRTITNHTTQRRRVVFMGDSFTQGVGVAWPETFVGRVAQSLAHQNIEVLNAGVIGYSPSIYYAKTAYMLRELGMTFDTLVVCIDISDPYNEAWDYNLAGDRVVDETTAEVWGNIDDWTHNPVSWVSYAMRGMAEAHGAMSRLALLCQVEGIELIVSVHPWRTQLHVDDRDTLQQKHWRIWCNAHRVRFVDAFPAFFAAVDQGATIDSLYIHGDCHWTGAGHAVMADAIMRGLQQHGKVAMQ